MLAPDDGFAQLAEVGQALVVEDDDFAVDDGVLDVESLSGRGEVAILGCPFETPPSEDAHRCIIDDDLRAISIEFDLVNSSVALGRLVDQGWHQRRDKLQPAPDERFTHRHSTIRI